MCKIAIINNLAIRVCQKLVANFNKVRGIYISVNFLKKQRQNSTHFDSLTKRLQATIFVIQNLHLRLNESL